MAMIWIETGLRIALVLSTVASALGNCRGGEHPFLIVQICLRDANNVDSFRQEMELIAQSEGMRFIDGSEETRENLAMIDKEGRVHRRDGPIIHFGVDRSDGMGVTAANFGDLGYQVALGFSEGSHSEEARMFARRVINRLARHWRVESVPPGMGAQPLRDC